MVVKQTELLACMRRLFVVTATLCMKKVEVATQRLHAALKRRMMSMENKEKCIRVKYNRKGKIVRSFKGELVTHRLIAELQILDETIREKRQLFKIMFEEIEDGGEVEKFQMYIGDGTFRNRITYEYLINHASMKE